MHIIPYLTIMPEVRTASTMFPTALAASNVPDPGARLVSSVEAVAASIQYLEEVLTASTALPMPVPMAATT
jgi:hypothetical protein